jgi:hypothetical protein
VDLDAFYAKATFYVRPERTLVLASVGHRVGGPGSGIWASGWSLGIGGRDLAPLPAQDVPRALMAAFLDGSELRVMTPRGKAAWLRTWTPSR